MNFSWCPFKKRSTGKLRLSQVSCFDSHGWNENFWVSNKILLGLLIFLLKVTFFCVNSKTENNPNEVLLSLLVQTLFCHPFHPIHLYRVWRFTLFPPQNYNFLAWTRERALTASISTFPWYWMPLPKMLSIKLEGAGWGWTM